MDKAIEYLENQHDYHILETQKYQDRSRQPGSHQVWGMMAEYHRGVASGIRLAIATLRLEESKWIR